MSGAKATIQVILTNGDDLQSIVWARHGERQAAVSKALDVARDHAHLGHVRVVELREIELASMAKLQPEELAG